MIIEGTLYYIRPEKYKYDIKSLDLLDMKY